MTASQFKRRNIEKVSQRVLTEQAEILKNWAKFRGPGWRPNQHDQSIMYRELCRSLRPARQPKRRAA